MLFWTTIICYFIWDWKENSMLKALDALSCSSVWIPALMAGSAHSCNSSSKRFGMSSGLCKHTHAYAQKHTYKKKEKRNITLFCHYKHKTATTVSLILEKPTEQSGLWTLCRTYQAASGRTEFLEKMGFSACSQIELFYAYFRYMNAFPTSKSLYHVCAMPAEARRWSLIPWDLSYRLLWAATWCWEPNPGPLKENQVPLTNEPSL